MSSNKQKKSDYNLTQKSSVQKNERVVLNTKKRNYTDLKENRDIKSVLHFVPRIIQINERKENQIKDNHRNIIENEQKDERTTTENV